MRVRANMIRPATVMMSTPFLKRLAISVLLPLPCWKLISGAAPTE